MNKTSLDVPVTTTVAALSDQLLLQRVKELTTIEHYVEGVVIDHLLDHRLELPPPRRGACRQLGLLHRRSARRGRILRRRSFRRYVSELGAEPDAFFNRVVSTMERLETALLEWNADGSYDASLVRIRAAVLKVCATIPAGDQSRANCESFLASLDAPIPL